MSRGFPLAGLLRLRNLQEEQAAADLARAHAERRRAAQRRHETSEALAGTSLPDLGDELTWRAAIAARSAMSSLIAEATLAHTVAGQRVDGATSQWSAARTRATALGKLEEWHEVAVRAEDERLEQLVLDEAAARTHRPAALPGAADDTSAPADPAGSADSASAAPAATGGPSPDHEGTR